MSTASQSLRPYIVFENVSKSFDDLRVLDGVSFQAMPAETLCIIGRSGVGKSVTLQLIMGFLRPDSGKIFIDGDDITQFSEEQMKAVRRKVTMVFQGGALFDSLTVAENVAFPLRERGELMEDQIEQIAHGLLGMVGTTHLEQMLPSDLSTGMKRAVAIARALAAQPEAVLYDEPTTMVDPRMAHHLGRLMQKVKQQLKLTSVVVTHDMRFAEALADRVLFLHEAKARFFGTLEEMHQCQDPDLRQFLQADLVDIPV
jgi:phospholipid/cholesterol/gamma-HCH transport system ATP-binding protein